MSEEITKKSSLQIAIDNREKHPLPKSAREKNKNPLTADELYDYVVSEITKGQYLDLDNNTICIPIIIPNKYISSKIIYAKELHKFLDKLVADGWHDAAFRPGHRCPTTFPCVFLTKFIYSAKV